MTFKDWAPAFAWEKHGTKKRNGPDVAIRAARISLQAGRQNLTLASAPNVRGGLKLA